MEPNLERGVKGRDLALIPITSADFTGLADADLSPWFNPFLPHFVRETLRCGGSVRGVLEGEQWKALTLHDPAESITSVFSRVEALAEELVRNRGVTAAYSDFRLSGPSETYGVYTGTFVPPSIAHAFRHSVRLVATEDLPRVADLLREVQGSVDDRWFEGVGSTPETGFLIEIGDRLAGVAWVAVVGRYARLHSLAVRPKYRRLGLGTDLFFARLRWAERAGASLVLSEIADRNGGSRAIAEAGGMRRAGELFLYPAESGVPVS